MNSGDLLVLTPLMITAVAGIVVMLAGALGARHETLHGITVAAIAAALASMIPLSEYAPREVTALLRVDRFALLFWVLIFATVGIVTVLARPYLAARRQFGEAFYALLLFATVGMGVLASSIHFVSFFLGLETLTISLYVLLGYLRDERPSLEAAAKYLILAAMTSAILLFGIALLYAATGSLDTRTVATTAAELLAGGATPEAAWVVFGSLMLLCGFAFKLALVPFHMWSPDVYQGAPAPVTALIATGSKGAVIAAMLRMVSGAPGGDVPFAEVLAALAIVTMLGGNLLALLQTDAKRLLAYSSIAHMGYVMVAMAAGGPAGGEAVIFYTITYVVTTLGTFGVVTVLSSDGASDVDDLAAYRGLGRRRPGLAAAFSVMLLSLAGVPPTGGFLAKFAVLSAAVAAGYTGLAMVMVVASAIAVYYYLRVLVVMYMEPAADTAPLHPATAATVGTSVGGAIALAFLVAVVLAIGVQPEPWLRAVSIAFASLSGS
jgi:NADH-quinone oxidoreductase subunit N